MTVLVEILPSHLLSDMVSASPRIYVLFCESIQIEEKKKSTIKTIGIKTRYKCYANKVVLIFPSESVRIFLSFDFCEGVRDF